MRKKDNYRLLYSDKQKKVYIKIPTVIFGVFFLYLFLVFFNAYFGINFETISECFSFFCNYYIDKKYLIFFYLSFFIIMYLQFKKRVKTKTSNNYLYEEEQKKINIKLFSLLVIILFIFIVLFLDFVYNHYGINIETIRKCVSLFFQQKNYTFFIFVYVFIFLNVNLILKK